MEVHIAIPAAEGTVLYRRLAGRFWKKPSVYLQKVNTQPADSQNSGTI